MPTLERQRYTDEEIERGLQAVVVHAGNRQAAHEWLAEQGLDIPRTTLDTWTRVNHAERYRQIRNEVAPRLQETIAAEYEDIVRQANGIQAKTLKRLDDQLDDLKPAELSTTARNVAVVQGLLTDKGLALRGQPTSIVEHRSPEESVQRLLSVLGTAIEVDEQGSPSSLPLATSSESVS